MGLGLEWAFGYAATGLGPLASAQAEGQEAFGLRPPQPRPRHRPLSRVPIPIYGIAMEPWPSGQSAIGLIAEPAPRPAAGQPMRPRGIPVERFGRCVRSSHGASTMDKAIVRSSHGASTMDSVIVRSSHGVSTMDKAIVRSSHGASTMDNAIVRSSHGASHMDKAIVRSSHGASTMDNAIVRSSHGASTMDKAIVRSSHGASTMNNAIVRSDETSLRPLRRPVRKPGTSGRCDFLWP